MKKLFKPVLFAAAIFGASHAFAQSGVKKTANKVGEKTSETAKDVGHATSSAAKDVGHTTSDAAKDVGHATSKGANKTAEWASKGKSALVDKRYKGKYGPNGEKVYIDSDAKYYYVDKGGHRVYATDAELVTKP